MKQIIVIILISVIFTSCATVITRKSYKLKLMSNVPKSQVQVYDSVYSLPAKVKVIRSKENLQVKLFTDTITKDFVIKSSPNPQFVFGNLFYVQLSPAAYLIDLTNQKRFYYGYGIHLDVNDTNSIIRPSISRHYYNYFSQTFPTNKGQINFSISSPIVNQFYMHPENETSRIGYNFWGISAGLEYFYKDNKYLSLTASEAGVLLYPVPVSVHYSGEIEYMNSIYLNLSDNFKYNRLSLGYGVNYSKNTWDYRYYEYRNAPPPSRDPVLKTSESIGFLVNGYYQFKKGFYIGVIYRPTFINVYPKAEFKYQHLASIDFVWKIRVKKNSDN